MRRNQQIRDKEFVPERIIKYTNHHILKTKRDSKNLSKYPRAAPGIIKSKSSGNSIFTYTVAIEGQNLVYPVHFLELTLAERMVSVFQPVIYLLLFFVYFHLTHLSMNV